MIEFVSIIVCLSIFVVAPVIGLIKVLRDKSVRFRAFLAFLFAGILGVDLMFLISSALRQTELSDSAGNLLLPHILVSIPFIAGIAAVIKTGFFKQFVFGGINGFNFKKNILLLVLAAFFVWLHLLKPTHHFASLPNRVVPVHRVS